MNANKTEQSIFKQVVFRILSALFFIGFFIANTEAYTVTNAGNSGTGSLREAITLANSTVTDDVIDFNITNCPNGTCIITLNGQLTINAASTAGKLTILGSAITGNVVINGNNTSRVLFVKAGADVAIDRVTITGGNDRVTDSLGGAGILVEFSSVIQSKLTITNSLITANSSANGGGIYNSKNGILSITNSIVSNNSATSFGAGIYNYPDATATITNSTINDSIAFSIGGIYNGGVMNVINSVITNNSATSGGAGGIYNQNTLIIDNTIVSNNTSQSEGGGIYNTFGTVTLTNSIVTNNSALQGGGIAQRGGLNSGSVMVTMTNCSVTDNTALVQGGGIYSKGVFNGTATLAITNSTVSNNIAMQNAGGIYNSHGNTQQVGMTITNSTISRNVATQNAGGIYNEIGNPKIANSTISGNTAGQNGGGLYNHTNTAITTTNSTFSNNTAQLKGGGIYDRDAGVKTFSRNSIIAGNIGLDGQPDISHSSLFGSTFLFISNGSNLIGNSNDTGSAIVWQGSDILNHAPKLSALGDYGGVTQTQALLNGSAAINSGNNCVLVDNGCGDGNVALPTDQRGNARNGNVDIGAFEVQLLENYFSKIKFDFDGDGRSDVSVFRPSDRNWYLNRSTQGFTSAQWGVSIDKIAPADYDGDGKTDIAVWRDEPSDPDRAYFYILQSANNTARAEQFGRTGDLPVGVGDWDGDGKADPSVYRVSNSSFYYRPSSSPSTNFLGIQWGSNGDISVSSDYDGDGKMDAAVFRPSNNTWYIRQSSNSQIRSENWGLSTDKPVPADYDGDGKTDVAVYRNGNWYLLRSSQGFASVGWGIATDIPVPADYDGDGKADFAVYRNGNWHISGSTQGFISAAFGISTDKPVPSAFLP